MQGVDSFTLIHKCIMQVLVDNDLLKLSIEQDHSLGTHSMQYNIAYPKQIWATFWATFNDVDQKVKFSFVFFYPLLLTRLNKNTNWAGY